MTTRPAPDAHPTHRNVRTIVDLERLGQQRKSFGDAIGERIARATGRLSFLALNVGVLAAWTLWNLYAPSGRRFDPYPFGLLTFVVSLEGVLIALFVLMAQNRMSQQADKRDHLHLQIALLTEQELTLALRMLRRLADRLDVPAEQADSAHEERFYEETDVNKLMETLERALPDDAARLDKPDQK